MSVDPIDLGGSLAGIVSFDGRTRKCEALRQLRHKLLSRESQQLFPDSSLVVRILR